MAASGSEKSSKKKTEKKLAAREEAKLLASFMGVMNTMRKQVRRRRGLRPPDGSAAAAARNSGLAAPTRGRPLVARLRCLVGLPRSRAERSLSGLPDGQSPSPRWRLAGVFRLGAVNAQGEAECPAAPVALGRCGG